MNGDVPKKTASSFAVDIYFKAGCSNYFSGGNLTDALVAMAKARREDHVTKVILMGLSEHDADGCRDILWSRMFSNCEK